MAIDPIASSALAAEARRAVLRQEVARHRSTADATANLAATVSAMNSSAHTALANAQAQLAALDSGSVLDAFGYRSNLDEVLRIERASGKAAAVDFVKANPACSEMEAAQAWRGAVGDHGLLDPYGLFAFYRARLAHDGVISAETWEAHRAWIVGAPRDQAVGQ